MKLLEYGKWTRIKRKDGTTQWRQGHKKFFRLQMNPQITQITWFHHGLIKQHVKGGGIPGITRRIQPGVLC